MSATALFSLLPVFIYLFIFCETTRHLIYDCLRLPTLLMQLVILPFWPVACCCCWCQVKILHACIAFYFVTMRFISHVSSSFPCYSRRRKTGGNNKETGCVIQLASSTNWVNHVTRVTTQQLKQLKQCQEMSSQLQLQSSYRRLPTSFCHGLGLHPLSSESF